MTTNLKIFLFSIVLLYLASDAEAKSPPNKKLYTRYQCYKDQPCPKDSGFCNELKTCECELGTVPVTITIQEQSEESHKTICQPLDCKLDTDCSDLWHLSLCKDTKLEDQKTVKKRCRCRDKTEYTQEGHDCNLDKYQKIGENCTSSLDCVDWAECDPLFGQCRCPFGHTVKDDWFCEQIACKEDKACSDVDPNSRCLNLSPNPGFCQCKDGYHYNDNNKVPRTTCVKGQVDDYCQFDRECPRGTRCIGQVSARCKCPPFHVKTTQGKDSSCELLKCENDADCRGEDSNTVCDKLAKSCKCASGYVINRDTFDDDKCEKMRS